MIEDIMEHSDAEIASPPTYSRRPLSKKRPLSKSFKQSLHIQPSVKTSLDISTIPENRQTEALECRICLDPELDSSNPLVSPCRCIGSVKYVHDQCYRKWLERLYTSKSKKHQEELIQNGVECQICKDKIFLNFENKYECASCTRVQTKIKNNKSLFAIFLIFIILNTATFSYLIYYSMTNSESMSKSIVTLAIVLGAFVFLGLTLLLTLFYFISDYFVDKIWKLGSFTNRKKPAASPFKSRYQVAPISFEELNQ